MFGLVSQKRFNELNKEYETLTLRLDKCREIEAKNTVLTDEILTLKNKLAKIEKQVREQVEADLFFISAKIQKELLEGKKKEDINDLRLQQIAYQHQLGQMQARSPYSDNFLNGYWRM